MRSFAEWRKVAEERQADVRAAEAALSRAERRLHQALKGLAKAEERIGPKRRKLRRMTVANGCTEAEAEAAETALGRMLK